MFSSAFPTISSNVGEPNSCNTRASVVNLNFQGFKAELGKFHKDSFSMSDYKIDYFVD